MPAPIGLSSATKRYGPSSSAAIRFFRSILRGGTIEGLTVYRNLAEIPAGRLTRISVYLPPELTIKILPEIAARGCDELWLNPGSESPEVVTAAEALRLEPIQACSIINVGVDPSRLR